MGNFVILSVATKRLARRSHSKKNPLAKMARHCHFERVKRAKNPKNLRHTLNLWILRFAQYDNVKGFWILRQRLSMTRTLSARQKLRFYLEFTQIFSSKILLFRGLPRRFCKNCFQRRVKKMSLAFLSFVVMI